MNFLKPFLSTSMYILISRVFGFFREIVINRMLGGFSDSLDCYSIGLKIPAFFRRIFAEGAFNVIFVPNFIDQISKKGKENAIKWASIIYLSLVLIVTICIIIFEMYADKFIPFLYPGFSKNKLDIIINFSRFSFPFILFISIHTFFGAILNSFDHFIAPSISPAFGNLFIIGSCCYLSDYFNDTHMINNDKIMKAMGFIIAISGLIQVITVYIGIKGKKIKMQFLKSNIPKKEIFIFFKKVIPGILGASIIQINLFVDGILSSFLNTGGPAIVYFAEKIIQLPLGTIGVAISTIMLPMLSKLYKTNKKQEAVIMQTDIVEFAMIITVACFIFISYNSYHICDLLLMGNTYSKNDINRLSHVLFLFSICLPFYILNKIFSSICFANSLVKSTIYAGIFSIFINFAIGFFTVKILQEKGILIGNIFAAMSNVICLFFMLYKHNIVNVRIFKIRKIIYICTPLTIPAYLILNIKYPQHLVYKGLSFILASIFYGIIMLFLCKIFNVKIMGNNKNTTAESATISLQP